MPLVLDKDKVIITGNTRYKAAQKLNIEEIPCIIASDLTAAQVKAYRIADNKTAEYSTWDNELLNIEFESLQEVDFNIDLTGFEQWEVENFQPVSDDDISDFFVDKEPKEKEPKKIQCPLCGGEFTQ